MSIKINIDNTKTFCVAESPEIYVTENGGAFIDNISDDKMSCKDSDRVSYLASHFSACKKAIEKGVNLKGYYLWSFLDNFEWAFVIF